VNAGRPNPLLDPTRQPPGTVAIRCVHGTFVSWCSPPALDVALVRCPPVCTDATEQRPGGA